MKKILFLICIILLTGYGCSNPQKDTIEQQQRQIDELKKQIEETKEQNNTAEEETKEQNNLLPPSQKAQKPAIDMNETTTNTPEQQKSTIEEQTQMTTENEKQKLSNLYRESLLKQLNSLIESGVYLNNYINIINSYLKNDVPTTINNYIQVAEKIGTFNYEISSLHIKILNTLKNSAITRQELLDKLNSYYNSKTEIYRNLYTDIYNIKFVDEESYKKIVSQIENYKIDLTEKRTMVKNLFDITNQEIIRQSDELGKTINQISSILQTDEISRPYYSQPTYIIPTFNITRCFISGENTTINCYGETF